MLACVSVCDATSMRCGVAQQVLREAADVAERRWRCTSPSGARRHVVGDRADVVDEAHVEHAVGFVEHQHLDVLEHGLAGLQVVEQAARASTIRMSSGPRSALSCAGYGTPPTTVATRRPGTWRP